MNSQNLSPTKAVARFVPPPPVKGPPLKIVSGTAKDALREHIKKQK